MSFEIRKYQSSDFDQLIKLLLEDDLGKCRESLDRSSHVNYQKAITEITSDENFEIFVMVENLSFEIIGCFQMMLLPHISFQGSKRCQVESVIVRKDQRGNGLGTSLMEYAINLSKEKGCGNFQLTSNKSRKEESHKFYRKLGMKATHEGYKLYF